MGDKLDHEKIVHLFAGAFLAPQQVLLSLIGEKRHQISLTELLILKEGFGMSIQALLYRMRELAITSTLAIKIGA